MSDQDNSGQAAGGKLPGKPPGFMKGLSAKLLWLTVVFVMLAEVLFFLPSIANMRVMWLRDRLNTAGAASVVIDGVQPLELSRQVQNDALMATGTKAIALRADGTSKLLVMDGAPPQVDATYDLTDVSMPEAMRDALETLVMGGDRVLRVFGPIGDGKVEVELVLDERSLYGAMLHYAKSLLVVSLLISIITALLIFLAINRMMIRPMRRLTRSMQTFAENPGDPGNILQPSPGGDEVAFAGRHLASMQEQLQHTLKQQKNLADLGLAVSKINHDMRNILASAQLMSDRLVDVDDPMVKSFAPKLLRTIDRAVGYTSEVLAYGQATEPEPRRKRFPLCFLTREVCDGLAVDPDMRIEILETVDADLEVDADSEQLFRVIHNICRNSVQALSNSALGRGDVALRIAITAHRVGSVVSIAIDDNGPGMPPKARENLFTAFRGSARSGGTGLGLAIARELVIAHGGTIALVEKPGPGTMFRIEIPDRPVALDDWRSRA